MGSRRFTLKLVEEKRSKHVLEGGGHKTYWREEKVELQIPFPDNEQWRLPIKSTDYYDRSLKNEVSMFRNND